MARQKGDKTTHQLELEIITLNEEIKALKLLATGYLSIIVICAALFFGITQYNIATKVDAALNQAALKKSEKLADQFATDAKESATAAKKYEQEARQRANKINDLYKPELDKLTKLNKLIECANDVTTMQVSKLKLGEKWLLSGVGGRFGNDHWLRLVNSTDTAMADFAVNLLWCKNGHVEGSDIAYKKNVVPLNNSLEKIQQLRAVKFNTRNSKNENDIKIGLIAQDVEKVFPEVVSIGPDGKKGINYSALIAALINSIQEQNKIIKKQNESISSLEKFLRGR